MYKYRATMLDYDIQLDNPKIITAWKVSKYRVFSSLYFPVFLNTGKYGQEKTPYLYTFHAVHHFYVFEAVSVERCRTAILQHHNGTNCPVCQKKNWIPKELEKLLKLIILIPEWCPWHKKTHNLKSKLSIRLTEKAKF